MQKFRANLQIKVPEVRVIGEEGEQLGVMSTADALKLAYEQELDLVEVAPNANPPVVKIVDIAKFRYQQQKAESQNRKNAKKTEVKTLRLSVRISENDLNVRAKQAEKFLTEGNLVRVELRMRGREQAFVQIAEQQIAKFPTLIQIPFKTEIPVKRMGSVLMTVLAPSTNK